DGLVKSNMEKLIFYAMSSPEKLDRIGAYLAERINRDLSRHRFGFVVIAIDAMDQLLVTCHSLNLFVQSYLKVVQLVLESQDADLQVLATSSFVKFANIEEDTPSYHRSYDFFVCKFSSLCHSNNGDLKKRKQLRSAGLNGIKGLIRKTVSDDLNNGDLKKRKQLRSAGLNGIKGLIRKTVSDDLQVQTDIWSEVHMEKIIPSLLFNMQCKDFEDIPGSTEAAGKVGGVIILAPDSQCSAVDRSSGSGSDQQLPQVQAEECLRELIARATFGHVHTILKPIIKHLDAHRLWEATVAEPSDKFAINSFKIIMYSIQPQHSYTVVQLLMNHLDSHSGENRIKVKTGIVNVLNEIISISVAQSIGPSVLGIISSLILHLRDSIHNINMKKYVEEERLFQEAVINTLGEFAANLPDYQKIETMIFIIDKAPPVSATSATDIQLQNIILKSLLKVTTKYKPVSMMQTFPS
ncbi:PREDICTED: protein EFR3 homolog cmp44E-like, partial [Rhagoletis zephyria]|uniref:protein EFR3 homolog cmp44E-like n=1 Tax=Rhagoletis zephyria TaxID=28612 RepID=UPI000811A209